MKQIIWQVAYFFFKIISFSTKKIINEVNKISNAKTNELD